jgi:hypothetical protein
MIDPDDMRAEVLRAMRETGTRPEIIFAYEKTGFLVNKEGRGQRVSPKNMQTRLRS